MFENNLHEVISAYIPHFLEKYEGDSNFNNQRNGCGYQEWKNDDFQKYSGEFLQDSLHGKGKYTWLRPSQSYMYEGGFYANNFEGYANLIRTDGQYFEGLMKNNRRFGPGVVTYPDGKQDVGLWDGPKLRRLSCVIMPEWVPKLATTPSGKVKLLKFRKLVPICPIEIDNAEEVLKKLGANSEVLQKSHQLYNKCVRHPKSKLFNKKLHDEQFFGQIDCTIEVADSKTVQTSSDSVSLFNNNAADEVLETLLENVDILKDFSNEQRQEIVAEKLEEMRQDYYVQSNENFIKSLLEILLEKTDDILKYPKEERVLIFNKNMMQNLLQSPQIKNDFPTKKIEVTDLLAWNNENISIEMMKHIFLYRNMENTVSFTVTKLLAGDRTSFNACGNHEKICVLFLINCSVGNDEIIENIFLNYDLNQDLCDARGNAGITFAAARDRWSTIRKLTNIGANLDVLNDEGLTPLVLCLLRYLAIKKSVGNWEGAFLTNTIVKSEEESQVTTEWRPHVPLNNLNQVSITTLYETYAGLKDGLEKLNLPNKPNPFIISECSYLPIDSLKDVFDEIKSIEVDMTFRNFQESYTDMNEPDTQIYIFKTSCKIPSTKTQAKAKAKTKTENEESPKPKKSTSTTEEFIITNKLKIVFTTIKILLSCGADPNIGQAPMPPLIISLYCGNEELLNLLLASSANSNIVTMDENLTPLHILAMLPFSKENADMFRILLKHNADPNCKANTYHWMEEKIKIIGKHVLEGEDLGKTPLHILCMRYDFNDDTQDYLLQMIKHLIDFKTNVHEYYLGHTPFSLAVLRGNLKLIKFFLDTSTADPNEKLGEGMGVALTVPILKRYANLLPLHTAMDVYDLLMQHNVNPLKDVNEMGNAIEFMYKEHEFAEKQKTKKNGKKKRSETSSKSSNTSSKRSKNKSSSTDDIKNYLLECARKMLYRHVQCNAFKHLAYFVLENADLEDEVSNTLAQFLTLSDAERIIQILLRKCIFRPNDTTYYISLQLLRHIKAVQIQPRKGKTEGDRRTPENILDNLDFDTIDSVSKFGLIEPEVDPNKDRYIVCFYCGRKVDQTLIACPICGLVYFCSEECNKLSIKKQGNLHKCRVLFYNQEKKKQDEFSALGFKYEFRSKLNDKLNEIKRDKLLKYLGREGRGDGLDVDFEQDFDLSDIGKRKFVFSTGHGVKGQGIPRSTWSSRDTYLQEEGRRKMPDEKLSKLDKRGKSKEGSRAISPEKGAQRKYDDTWSEEDVEERKRKARTKEGAKFKYSGRPKDGEILSEESELRKHKESKKDKFQGGTRRRGKDESAEKLKDIGDRTKRNLLSKGKGGRKGEPEKKGVRIERDSLVKGKGGRKGEPEKKGGRIERDSLVKGKGGRKGEPEKKGGRIERDSLVKGKGGRKGEPEKKGGRIERDSLVKGKVGKGGKSGGEKRETSTVMKTKIAKDRTKGVTGILRGPLRIGDRKLGQEMSIKREDKFGTERKLGTELEMDKSKMQLSLMRFPYRKGQEQGDIATYAYSKLSKKYQHFLEILSEFFPDFDLCMLLLPYACFVDGQLYYRFLDERPSFCLTFSNV